jgi:putative transposase
MNEMWSINFVSNALFDGRLLRALMEIDAFTQEGLAIDLDPGSRAASGRGSSAY